MITIIDCGMGNLRSVAKAFEHIGKKTIITSDRKKILKSSLVVLPGVGSFTAAMTNLKKLNLTETVKNIITVGKPFLGLCLGLQILFEKSEEGNCLGLGIFHGKVRKFSYKRNLKIPHMGWNNIKLQITNYPSTLMSHDRTGKLQIFKDIPDNSFFYFVHSYYVEPKDKKIIATTTNYGINFASSVFYKNIFATQFHPEKSQKNGLKLLKNYVDYTGN
ncbi:MAG: imidazole glycerol phosphate synthase subunit HisH [Elusimicrobia bacterium CG06_land_8_20_14_3_00_38_11]|nr:MAG: imidazole glycerol phosphate synthase subunit HisH [Elusimicrobia bacterium CG06_land_8_20_14_3_00_38_11]